MWDVSTITRLSACEYNICRILVITLHLFTYIWLPLCLTVCKHNLNYSDSQHTFSQVLFISSSPLLFLTVSCLLKYTTVLHFFIYFWYFQADCSSEVTNWMPAPLLWPHYTRLFTEAHPYNVKIPYTRMNQHPQSFILHAGKHWNNLLPSVFTSSQNLNC